MNKKFIDGYIDKKGWICPVCGFVNAPENKICVNNCGKYEDKKTDKRKLLMGGMA